jgi:chromatin structure-remodeling complex protein RSC7
VDDYYEDYAKKECEEKGFKPGDVVQEPAEPIGYTSTTAADIIVKGAKESRTGIYKAGGPTTFFGSDGVGPFRGEMSSTKKAMLARENLTEENWMAACAYSVWESNDELRVEREGRVVAGAGVEEARYTFGPGDQWSTTIYTPAATPAEGAAKADDLDAALRREDETMAFEGDSADEAAAAQAKASLAARQAALYKPRAVFEVHTGQLHCEWPTSILLLWLLIQSL